MMLEKHGPPGLSPHGAAPCTPGERLRQFAAGIVQLLEKKEDKGQALRSTTDPSLMEALEGALVAKMQDAALRMAEELQAELPAWRAALEHLHGLAASRYFPAQQLAEQLQRQLEDDQQQALRLVAAFESLRAENGRHAKPSLRAGVPSACDSRRSAEPYSSDSDQRDQPPLPQPAQQASPAVSQASRPAEPGPSLDARETLQRGNQYWRRGEHQQALAFFTKAIQQDPHFVKAHVKRGQAHHCLGDYQHAIDDFTAALRIDSASQEAYFRRGEAHAKLLTFKSAADDYGQALNINPKFILARHNRAVVYHLTGDHRLAIAELNEVLGQDPKYAPAYFNRGVVYLSTGDHAKAAQDLTRALELNPDDAEASSKLAKVRRLMEPSGKRLSEKETGKQATGEPQAGVTAAPGSSGQKDGPLLLKQETAVTNPAKGANSIGVVCPDCGACGEIPWDRLGRVLACKGCARHYRVKGAGHIVPVTQTDGGKWIETAQLKRPRRLPVNRWTACAAAAVLAMVMAGASGVFSPSNSAAAATDLPRELEPRVELFTRPGWPKICR
jgi:tetratricopeptide (TPR) repeat protein